MTDRRGPMPIRSWRFLAARALALVAIASLLILPGHAQQSARAKTVGKRLMCMCGCGQVLIECNHLNCPLSGPMLKELDRQVAAGSSDDLIVQGFVQEFGQKVMAEPPARGFNALAWWMPGLVVLVGLLLVRTVLLRWRQIVPATPAGSPPPPEMLARVRREAGEED